MLKRNTKKRRNMRLMKKTRTPKKIGTLRLFSHIISQCLLPKGGRGEALHYLDIKQASKNKLIIAMWHIDTGYIA